MFNRLKMTVAALALTAGTAFAAQDTLTVGMVLEPPNLDPTGGAAAAIDEVVYANVFEGLTRFGSDGAVLPALASSWDVSEDGLTYTFHLQAGVKFHDGTDMNADDVVFSLNRARAEDSTNAQKALFKGIASVVATDATTAKVSVIYNEKGEFETFLIFPTNPAMVFVDTTVIANAPVEYLVHGMGDTLATYFEADMSQQTATPTLAGGLCSRTALMAAQLSFDILMEYGLQALQRQRLLLQEILEERELLIYCMEALLVG